MTSRKKVVFVVAVIGAGMITAFALWQNWAARKSRGPAPAAIQCRFNLRTIDAAKQQWMTEHQKASNDIPVWEDLRSYLSQQDRTNLACPSGGAYTIGRLSDPPTCSYPGHTLK